MTAEEYLATLGDLHTYHPSVIKLIKQAYWDGQSAGAKEAFTACGVSV